MTRKVIWGLSLLKEGPLDVFAGLKGPQNVFTELKGALDALAGQDG